jgi:hypothetical protein
MSDYFVYKDPSGEWSVSHVIDADNWEHLISRPTWEQAKNHAFALARIDHDYNQPLPARMVVVR